MTLWFFVFFLLSLAAYRYLLKVDKKECKQDFLQRLVSLKKSNGILAGIIGVVSILIVIAGYIYLDVSVINIGLYAFAFDFLAVAGVIDSKYHIIPNSLVVIGLFAFAFFVVMKIILREPGLLRYILFSGISGLGIGGSLLLISLIAKNSIGMGDVKLFFVIGILLGFFDSFAILFLTALVMSIMAILLLLLKKTDIKSSIPMGPFAALGYVIFLITIII